MNTLSTLKGLCKLSWMLPVLILGTGCVGAPDSEQAGADERVAEADEAFSGYWGYSWATATEAGATADLGSDTGRTCFLSGVGGDLHSDQGAPGGYGGANASLTRSGGHWWLTTSGYVDGAQVKATALCVPSDTNRTAMYSWGTGDAAVDLGSISANPNRRCGLTGVWNTYPYYDTQAWNGSGDGVYIYQSAGHWYLGGTGGALGSAICVDATSGTGYGTWTWGAGSSTSTLNLLQVVDHGTDPLGAQCFLTGVKGAFQTDSYSNGVFINYAAGTTQWSMTVSPYKTGYAICIS